MNKRFGDYSRTDLIYLLFLLILISVYALHLFSFTVFEGFSTLSNDSFSYIRLARNWSPYADASTVNALTLPEHPRPPGFAWLLAISGAAESTYAGHQAVSIAMLISIALFGWLAYREMGWLVGGLLTVGSCLLPGAVISTMGILSENLYLCLSLTTILLVSVIINRVDSGPGWYIALFLSLSLLPLTRTIGVALVAAIIVVSLFDHNVAKKKRITFLLLALMSIVSWQIWGLLSAENMAPGQITLLSHLPGHENETPVNLLTAFLGIVRANFNYMPTAWNHYLSLTHENIYFLVFAYALLILCIFSLLMRALQLRLDALYLLFYFGILSVYPFPEALVRFLHPVMMILLIQPALYFRAKSSVSRWLSIKTISISIILVLIFNSLYIQRHLIMLRNEARKNQPAIVHSLEYYDIVDREEAVRMSNIFQVMMRLMAGSKELIPPGSIVAADKHEALMLLADRESVMLSVIVPYPQQLCNFKIRSVDYVFVSVLTSSYNLAGLKLLEHFRDISSYVWSTNFGQAEPIAHLLTLDMPKIDSILSKSGFDCQSFQVKP